mgnify:CR=1 FL=1
MGSSQSVGYGAILTPQPLSIDQHGKPFFEAKRGCLCIIELLLEGLCETVKVSGLGLPAEMVSYTLNGCAPEFALWSFVDLGYLTYYATLYDLPATERRARVNGLLQEGGEFEDAIL